MVELLMSLLPGLRFSTFQMTSPPTPVYNCIAWAAGQTLKWWWPTTDVLDDAHIWPDGVPNEVTLPAFTAAFATLNYFVCENDAHEGGWEKVAIFVDERQTPTHAARQLANGRWTSKLGKAEDIEHDLHALEGDVYGKVAMLLKRPIQA